MGRVMEYLKKYKKEVLLSPLFKFFEAVLEMFVPIIIATVIDKGIYSSNTGYVVFWCVMLIIIAIFGLAAALCAQYFAAKAACYTASDLRLGLFDKIQSLHFDMMNQHSDSTLIARLTDDVNQVQNGINLFLRLVLRSPLVVIGSMIMAFTINIKSALVFVLVIFLLSIAVVLVMGKGIKQYKATQKHLDGEISSFKENISGARVMRAFSTIEREYSQFSSKNSLLMKAQIAAGKITAIMNPLTYIIVNLGIVCVLYVSYTEFEKGILLSGSVVALYNYMGYILVELIKFANLIINVSKALACASRVQNIFDIEIPKDNKDAVSDKSVIEFKDVCFSYYNNSNYVLKNIDLTIKSGEVIGLIGTTGSGKSTLASLIAGYYEPTSGQAEIYGVKLCSNNFSFFKEKSAFVFQKPTVFNMSVKDNIQMGADLSDEDVLKALDFACAKEFVEEKEGGINYICNERGSDFSGGQKQRLAIARAFAKKSDLIIFDDSTSALDYITEKKIISNIRNSFSDKTVIIVAQRPSSVLWADRIVVLKEGQIVAIGKHKDLLVSCDEYKEIYLTQYSDQVKEVGVNE